MQDMAEEQGARDQFGGAHLHQHIVGGDVGFTFGAVEDQGVDHLGRFGRELHRRWKTCTTQASHTGRANFIEQGQAVEAAVIFARGELNPLVFAVRLDHHGFAVHPGWMRNRALFNGDHGTRGRCMGVGAEGAVGSADQLPGQNRLAHLHHRLCGGAHMLVERNYQYRRERHSAQR